MKITIIGTGAYSLGIALMLSKKENNTITLWTEDESKRIEFSNTHQIKSIFKDIVFPNNINITDDLEEALNKTKLIFLITSVKYINDITIKMQKYYQKEPVCIASKGIDNNTLLPLSKIVKRNLKTSNVSVISGPTFAIDLVNNNPVALAIAGNKRVNQIVMKNLVNDTLKLRESSDIIGIQLCGSIKNVFAIASGIINGLGYQESTNAFLINEALHDMKNIIKALGGKKKTILSFAGVGDLLLTCTTPKSRNYSFGYLIGSNNNKDLWQEYLNNNTVEGYYTLKSIYKLLKQKGINIPLINVLYDIVEGKKEPSYLVKFLIKKA